MVLLGPSVNLPHTGSFHIGAPSMGAQAPCQGSPVHSSQAPIVLIPDNASILRVLSARTHTCMHTYTHMHAHTQRADCALTCTPASPGTQALFPCCTRPGKPMYSCGIPQAHGHGSPALAASGPGPGPQEPRALAGAVSVAEKVFWALPSLSSGAQLPGSSPAFPLPPHIGSLPPSQVLPSRPVLF